MTTQRKIVLVVVLTIVAFAAGYYFAPEKIKIETKVVEVEKKETTVDKESSKNKHKEIKTTEVTRPDGTKETTTSVVEDSSAGSVVSSDTKESSTHSTDTTKEVEKSGRHINLSLLAGATLSSSLFNTTPVYGGHISTTLLGPISIGVWGLTDKTFGASLGLAL